MNKEHYINAKGHLVLEYLSNDTIVLDLPFILTQGKRLTKGMPYMKSEKRVIGEDIAAIKLLHFQDYAGVVYLNVRDLKTDRCYNLSWNMEIDGEGVWFWSLADFNEVIDLPKPQ